MNIGILTFHWATNYGAILQAYALQTYLESIGHHVEIINYKPLQYEFCFRKYLKYPKLLKVLIKDFQGQWFNNIKESRLAHFREQYLHLTQRCYTKEDVAKISDRYDILISGSDQILNPGFTLNGELQPTSTYYLDFSVKAKKIGYAVSFGCVEYPEKAATFAEKWIKCFDCIGVRESSGLSILDQLSFKKEKKIVPDPTILCGTKMLDAFDLHVKRDIPYTYVYMLRGRMIDSSYQPESGEFLTYADYDVRRTSMTKWLESIGSAIHFITNSYHGMIISILFHVSFAVILENGASSGMNDRFFTLLGRLNLLDRIVSNNSDCIRVVFSKKINWEEVDHEIEEFRKVGVNFLMTI